MHLAAHTWMRPESLGKTLKRLKTLGYSSIELAGEPSLYPVEKTRSLLDKYGITCHGTLTMQHGSRDLVARDPQQRRNTISYMKDVAALCAQLGGTVTTVVPANVGTRVPAAAATATREWRWAVEGLREVAAYAQAWGVRLAIEPRNRFETYFVNRTDQALALADEVGYGCGVAFDVFHAALEQKDVYEAIRACKGRILDFHASDHNRSAAGDGNIDWYKIMLALIEADYDGPITVECLPPIDRSPIGDYGRRQQDFDPTNASMEHLKYVLDHGSNVVSDEYYTELLRLSAETLQPLIEAGSKPSSTGYSSESLQRILEHMEYLDRPTSGLGDSQYQ